ncbi:MAG: GspE/PulE family protein [Candidatus Paceibacterota bacterium]|jgi:type II secretory ATPase GspE/PulE/Tfp pilus assembly ATPase PilB-like protein
MNDQLDEKRDRKIDELYKKEAEELAQVLAVRHQLPYIDLSKIAINTDALRMVPLLEAREAGLAVFRVTGRIVHVVIMSTTNEKYQEIIEDLKRKNLTVNLYLASENSLNRAWDMYAEISASAASDAGLIQISDAQISSLIEKLKTLDDIRTNLGSENTNAIRGSGISIILEMILAGALVTDSSDIHFEPEFGQVRLRYRLDGVLLDIVDMDEKVYRQILSRIKLVSGLKLNVKKDAQDGRFSIKVQDTEIEIRTSTIPSAYGESIVMRVLNPKNILTTFEKLGVESKLYSIFEREINKPNGLVLLTGPTGSGKTTTLYAFLRKVNSSENKIITIEDPIEYHLEGISQTQVNEEKGYTFAAGLRSALRQDPDVIMVGEIRDGDTAETAINSALTGHLVFSTLHTNNAAGAIPRLIELKVNPKILSSALTLSIAQRLIRKLCENCKKKVTPDEKQLKLLNDVAESIRLKRPDIQLPTITEIYEPGACPLCNQTGYKGRLGVFEAVLMDQAVAAIADKNPDEREIRIAAKPQGILDMRQDGIVRVINGITSLAELGRVVDLGAEII